MNKLTIQQLKVLEREIDGLGRFSPRYVASNLGLSKTIVYEARFLINCQPLGWQACLEGKRTIRQVYRSCGIDRGISKIVP